MTPNTITCGEWPGCYDDSWKGLITPESFCHPAKMARGLLARILRHAKEEGWLKPGDVVLDCFAGVFTTGILGAYENLNVVGIELEPRFVKLAQDNIALHAKKLAAFDCPQPVIIQGDSRELCRIVQEADIVISSPPFHGVVATQDPNFLTPGEQQKIAPSKSNQADYGTSPGQLGAMKAGSIDCVIASPPYAETLKGDGSQAETAAESRAKRKTGGGSLGQSQRTQGYGSKGNLGNLKPGSVDAVVASPPYAEAHKPNTSPNDVLNTDRKDLQKWAWNETTQGTTPGNLGNLKPGDVDLICSSPPYEGCPLQGGGDCLTRETREIVKKTGKWPQRGLSVGNQEPGYGKTSGQLGNTQGDTFWGAAKIIVEQCHRILKPQGICIWIVKDFVRNKKRVDFTGDWRRLCESVGFQALHEHHASLIKETKLNALFGEIFERVERKSFFRRLAEKKGSPRIDYETVLCTQKYGGSL